jgi:3-mercaptopropionate dioxygenase
MCFPTDPSPSGVDEYYVDSPTVSAFIDDVRARMDAEPDRARLVEDLKPAFRELLSTTGWLPEEFASPDETSGMGGGIGQYVLYRAGDRSLSLFSLVVPAGSSTPVHDHLAWGLVGLYQGRQHERVYRLIAGDPDSGHAELDLAQDHEVDTGDFYALLPPDGDIHQVTTISDEPSISIHLLGNDTGCVIRHRYEPETSTAAAFRSGYSNLPCDDESPGNSQQD